MPTQNRNRLDVFSGGTIQILTDVVIDPAGNVWAANNWNNPEAAVYSRATHSPRHDT